MRAGALICSSAGTDDGLHAKLEPCVTLVLVSPRMSNDQAATTRHSSSGATTECEESGLGFVALRREAKEALQKQRDAEVALLLAR